MKVHFIAIGGSAMHNLAIALHKKGFEVSGSDDEIFDPSRKRLLQHGLLPEQYGWFPEKIDTTLDAIILGMHARADNPELVRARELKLQIYSYPEYIFEQSKEKTRIVIGGSHGKTTITSMVIHVLQYHTIDTDYMVGAQLDGFDVMVKLSVDAPFIVIEGDEYLSSPLDPRPKFHIYRPHIALISGIAWDHINVFSTFEMYLDQFRRFIHCIEKDGKLIYCAEDELVAAICKEETTDSLCLYPYGQPEFEIHDGKVIIIHQGKSYPVLLFGRHNLLNMEGARKICMQLGVTDAMFFDAIQHFKGASKRLEEVFQYDGLHVFRDFAHAPSKIKASTLALKEFYPTKKIIACMELHTYSSLNQHFLEQYRGSLDAADEAIVFFDPHALKLKRLPDLEPDCIINSFKKEGLKVFTDTARLFEYLCKLTSRNTAWLFMSSGNFGGLNFNDLFSRICPKQA